MHAGEGGGTPIRDRRVLVCVYYYSRYFMLRLYSRVASVRYNTRLFKVLLVEHRHTYKSCHAATNLPRRTDRPARTGRG